MESLTCEQELAMVAELSARNSTSQLHTEGGQERSRRDETPSDLESRAQEQPIEDLRKDGDEAIFPFLALPGELRNLIYNKMFPPQPDGLLEAHMSIDSWARAAKLATNQHLVLANLALSNRRIRSEVTGFTPKDDQFPNSVHIRLCDWVATDKGDLGYKREILGVARTVFLHQALSWASMRGHDYDYLPRIAKIVRGKSLVFIMEWKVLKRFQEPEGRWHKVKLRHASLLKDAKDVRVERAQIFGHKKIDAKFEAWAKKAEAILREKIWGAPGENVLDGSGVFSSRIPSPYWGL